MKDYTDLIPTEDDLDKKEEARIWAEISQIEGVSEYLRQMKSRDMKLHFSCPKDQQDMVHGAFYRTEYFLNMLKKNSGVDK